MIRPEDYSASCKQIINRDFSEDHDDYSFVNTSAKEKEKYKDLCNFISQVNLVRDSMEDDETNVLPINFARLVSF